MAAVIQNLVYSRKVDGRDKPVYTKCGVLITKDDGSQSVKLELIPVGFTGWLNVYDQKPREEYSQAPAEESYNDSF